MHSRKTWAFTHIASLRRALPPAWGVTTQHSPAHQDEPHQKKQPWVRYGCWQVCKSISWLHYMWVRRITQFTPALFHVLCCPHQIYKEDFPRQVVVASMQLLLQVGYSSLRKSQRVSSGYGHLDAPRHSVLQGTLNAKRGMTILSHAL